LRLTFLIEGEEEMGSPSFTKFLESHKDGSRRRIRFSLRHRAAESRPGRHHVCLRGLALLDVHVTGAKGDLHSDFTVRVRNPIQALAEIIATLHTPEGA